MSDQFVAEIRIFPFNFPPTGWAFCDGQLMPISQNTALFALLGTTYGGDGKSMFKLGEAHERGRGVAPDPVAALSWYTLAAQQGYERAGGRSTALAATLDPGAVAAAEQQAAAWRRDHDLP